MFLILTSYNPRLLSKRSIIYFHLRDTWPHSLDQSLHGDTEKIYFLKTTIVRVVVQPWFLLKTGVIEETVSVEY